MALMVHAVAMSPLEYQTLVQYHAAVVSDLAVEADGDEGVVAADALKSAQQECEGYGLSRLLSVLSLALRQCVADAVQLTAECGNPHRFNTPTAFVRELAARVLALEAQEVAYRQAAPAGG